MKFKRTIAMLSSITLIATMLGACQVNKAQDNTGTSTVSTSAAIPEYINSVGEYPITKEKITLKVLGRKDPGGADWSTLEIFKRLAAKTNITLEFELADASSFKEKKNIQLVGGQYPDIILRSGDKTDEETYGPQGVFLDLTDLVDKYAPNIKKLMKDKPEVKAAITSMNGKIYGLPYFFETATTQGHTGFFDSQWMKNVGIEKVPSTTDELYTMLKLFKENDANGNGKNDEISFSCVGLTTTIQRLLIPAFTGMSAGIGFDIDDSGKVVYVPAMPQYKDFLIYCNKLYKEGLLDPEFATQTSQQWVAKAKSGIVGVYNGSPTMLDAATVNTEQLSLPALTSPSNSKAVLLKPYNTYTTEGVITNKCKYPEAAMRLLDMFYATPENAVDGFSGITVFAGYENEHWKYSDSTKTKYEWIDPIKGFANINKTVSVNMELPGRLEFLAMPFNDKLMTMKVTQVQKMQKPYYREAYPINARFTAEESSKGNVIENDLYSSVTEWTTKFITGDRPINDFDKYIAELNKIGLKDLITIKEAALKRWTAALK